MQIQPPLEADAQTLDVRRPPPCIGRHADQHARGRVLHVQHQNALAADFEGRHPIERQRDRSIVTGTPTTIRTDILILMAVPA